MHSFVFEQSLVGSWGSEGSPDDPIAAAQRLREEEARLCGRAKSDLKGFRAAADVGAACRRLRPAGRFLRRVVAD